MQIKHSNEHDNSSLKNGDVYPHSSDAQSFIGFHGINTHEAKYRAKY